MEIHVRTVTGLEQVLADELSSLGAQKIQPKNRLVICEGDLELVYRINLWSRTAIRVLLPLRSFEAPDEKAFYEGVAGIDWTRWIRPGNALAVDANIHSSFTSHSLYLSQLTKDAIVDQFRDKGFERPSVDLENPDLRLSISLYKNTAQISLDSSGESLHKRGYRKKTGVAPVNETLAAGILKLIQWDSSTPLIDPMCGSGTFLIEAGLMLRNMAPGLFRNFGFQRWPDWSPELWQKLVTEARNAIEKDKHATILGFDIDAQVIEAAQFNIQAAGLSDLIQVKQADFLKWDEIPITPGTLVLNPPYDERLPVDNTAQLYQEVGDRLKRHYPGWTAHILSGNLEASKYIGLKASRRTLLYNGAIECRLLKFEINKEVPSAAPPRRNFENPKWTEKYKVFGNRIQKNFQHYSKWTKREGVSCWRVYNWDIPELPYMVDLYGDRLHFAEIERNHEHTPVEHGHYVQGMVRTAAQILGVSPDHVYFKKRKPQKIGAFQYEPHAESRDYFEVTEGGHKFLVNLGDYLDVGLFLDHRNTRKMVQDRSLGKHVLNLFAYTGSFTVYAAAGGAKTTTTVDTNRTYLNWAESNLKLNGFEGDAHRFVRSDSFEFLQRTNERFDLVIVDPPTRSVNKSSGRSFQIQEDHVKLLRLVLSHLTKPGGTVFFSTNYRSFELDEEEIRLGNHVRIKEITGKTVPIDFERKPSHRCWLLET